MRAVGIVSRDADFRVEDLSELKPMTALAPQCPHASAIASIQAILASASDGKDSAKTTEKESGEKQVLHGSLSRNGGAECVRAV